MAVSMEKNHAPLKKCGCKGIRSCLLCESQATRPTRETGDLVPKVQKTIFTYCEACRLAWEENEMSSHPHHHGSSVAFSDIAILPDFVSAEEEAELMTEIDKTPFTPSQSGRQKQDYGPKVNFKKRKLRCSVFTGLPPFVRSLYERMRALSELRDFVPVELCNLDYAPCRGSSIDPHFDDFWVWGPRLVTLNLLSETVLHFVRDDQPDLEIRVVLPQRSLVVVAGDARNVWKHGIHRHDITARRLAMTFRELTPEFLEGGAQAEVGRQLVETALTFAGSAV